MPIYTDPVLESDSLTHQRLTLNDVQSKVIAMLNERVTFYSETEFSVVDADTEIPLFGGVLEGAAPLTDFTPPIAGLTWSSSLSGPKVMEILFNVTIGSSSPLTPGDKFLTLELMNGGSPVWQGRIHDPGGNSTAGVYSLRYYDSYFALAGHSFRFTCSGDAQFFDVSLNTVAVEVRTGVL
jgi:hypothetical protein